jgi:DNA invertase Pin-like site-specific DNA recombinase
MVLRAVGYRRVSTDEQAEGGHSLDAQEETITDFVARRKWQFTQLYTDAGLSGARDDRPALQQLLHDAERGKFDVLVVSAVDRFYRSLPGLLRAIELLNRHNVSFVSTTENLDFTTPWGKLTLAVLGTLAEIYLDKLKAETTKGLQKRAKKGLHNGSVPFGYCKGLCATCADLNGPGYCPRVGEENRGDGKTLLAHPLDAIGLRRTFKLSASGEWTDRDIATYLNETPVRYRGKDYILRPRRRAHQVQRFGPPVFQKDGVRDMLLRPFYTGLVPYYGVNERGQKRKRQNAVALYPGKHPALVPQDLYDQVQRARKMRRTAPGTPRTRTKSYVYPLSGLLVCGHCGKKMRASSNKNGTRYYRCATRLQQRDSCVQITLRADWVEEAVMERLLNIKLPADWRERLRARFDRTDESRRAERGAVKQKLARLRELYLEGDIERDDYQQRRENYRESLANLTDIRLTAMIATGFILQHIREIIATADEKTIKKLLQALLTAVITRDKALTAWQPNSASYPLLKNTHHHIDGACHSGSDGRGLFQK